jgi:hypothetical protein
MLCTQLPSTCLYLRIQVLMHLKHQYQISVVWYREALMASLKIFPIFLASYQHHSSKSLLQQLPQSSIRTLSNKDKDQSLSPKGPLSNAF